MLIAAATAGRICLGMEVDPLYVDVTVRRWQAFTGKEARLAGADRPFVEFEAERSAPEEPTGGQTAPPTPSTEALPPTRANAKG